MLGCGDEGSLGYGQKSSVGAVPSYLPIDAGDVSVGWDVSVACRYGVPFHDPPKTPSGALSPMPTPTDAYLFVSAQKELPTWALAVIGAFTAVVVCVTITVFAVMCLLRRSMRVNASQRTQHEAQLFGEDALRRDSHGSGAGSARASRHGGGRSLANSAAPADAAGPLPKPLHQIRPPVGYDVLRLRPKSRSISRGYIVANAPRMRGSSNATALACAMTARRDAQYESSTAALGVSESILLKESQSSAASY
jgi:hypothetical protein